MKRLSTSFTALIVTLVTVAPLVGCDGGVGGLLISNQQEVEIGQGVDEQIRYEFAIADPGDPVSVWAAELVAPLVTGSAPFRDPAEIGGYKVAVIADDALVNAFAAPGGFTYISTGLILQSTTCAEIAGVMGHELAHVTERHGVEQMGEAVGISVILDAIFGEGITSDMANTLWGVLQNTTFSQDAESESDMVGLQIAFNAGYNPFGLVDFFEKLLQLAGGEAGFLDFLSSHPPTQDRVNESTSQIGQQYGDAVVRGSSQTYDCVGTTQQLAAIQAHIQGGGVTVIPGTGQGPPPAPNPADGATDE